MSEDNNTQEADERLLVLETKVVYQDQIIEDLNGVVTQQQDQLDRLAADVRKLTEMLESIPHDGVSSDEEPPPPHY
jgi:SlyX protein